MDLIKTSYDRLGVQLEWMSRESGADDATLARAMLDLWQGEEITDELRSLRQALTRWSVALLGRGPTLSSILYISMPIKLQAIAEGNGSLSDALQVVRTMETGVPHDDLAAAFGELLSPHLPEAADLWRLEEPLLSETLEGLQDLLSSKHGETLGERVIERVAEGWLATAPATLEAREPLPSAEAREPLPSAKEYVARARKRVAALLDGESPRVFDRTIFVDAIADVDAALVHVPDLVEGWVLRARLLVFKAGAEGPILIQDIADAEAALQRADASGPRTSEFWVGYGQLQWRFYNDHRAAIGAFASAIDLDSDDIYSRVARGTLSIDIGDMEGAWEDAEHLIALCPERPAGYWIRARVREITGRTDSAIEDYDTALRLDPKHVASYQSRGVLRHNLGDVVGAMADANQAVALFGDGTSHYNRGTFHFAAGRFEEALADFDAAVLRNPLDSAAFCNRGNTKIHLSDLAGARDDFEAAIRVSRQSYPLAHMNLGVALIQLGDFSSGVKELKAALECAPAGWHFRAQIESILYPPRSPI